MRTIATAGHVDHGKSSLVLALTGTDPDRWEQEKRRGMTIDIGFGFCVLDSGQEIGFVDVPGHIRFLKNMLAGVSGVDIALLVVSATEGWMAQSEEHLQVLELLGISYAVVALTKVDSADEATALSTEKEIQSRFKHSPLSDAPIVWCDSITGRGIADLRRALDVAVRNAPPPLDWFRPRLWIDRVFSAQGAGTVVTGTLTRGDLELDSEIEVGTPPQSARIRKIECAKVESSRVSPGARVAINIGGVSHQTLSRGDALVADKQWIRPRVIDVELISRPPNSPLSPKGRLTLYLGTGEYEVDYRLIDKNARWARITLPVAIPLAIGDRAIVRDSGTARTIAGAEILDLDPTTKISEAASHLERPFAERVLSTHPWLTVDDLVGLTGCGQLAAKEMINSLVTQNLAVAVGQWVVVRSVMTQLKNKMGELVNIYHQDSPHGAGIELAALATKLNLTVDQLRAAITSFSDLTITQGRVHSASYSTETLSLEAQQLIKALSAKPFSPPTPTQLGADPELVKTLLGTKKLVDLDGIIFSAEALADAQRIIINALEKTGELSIANVRDLLGSSRKFILPIMNWLDHSGVTRRRGDLRVAGPRSGLTTN